jgi:collagen beta-1,O-galactosyltransferase
VGRLCDGEWGERLVGDIFLWNISIFQQFLDADAFLSSPKILYELIDLELPIVAPMLISDGLYSNFWCGMSEHFYYQRTENYTKIRNFEILGEYKVPMIHSAVLIDLNHESSELLTFDKDNLNKLHNGVKHYNGPIDDIIIFAISANYSGTEMYISNTKNYGYILTPLDQEEKIEEKDFDQLANVQLFILNFYEKIHVKPELKKFVYWPKK